MLTATPERLNGSDDGGGGGGVDRAQAEALRLEVTGFHETGELER